MFERYFTPYHTSAAAVGERIAILAPHPDDEVFGCGASACKWSEQGRTVQAFVITAGVVRGEFGEGDAAQYQRDQKAALRADESRGAAKVLGLPEPIFLGAQDGELWDDSEIGTQLLEQLTTFAPTTLVVPSIWEMHRDHRTTAELGMQLAQQLTSVQQLTFYEVGVPLTPNVIEDITSHQEIKWQAMQCFPSQLVDQHYAEQMKGLNKFRSYTLGTGVLYAEAFYCVPKEDIEAFAQTQAPSQATLTLKAAEQQSLAQSQTIQQLQQRIDVQQDRISELEQMLYQTHQSLSWRYTRPIRWLRGKLRR